MSPDHVNTSPGVAAVLRELDGLHQTIRENRDAVRADLVEHREEVAAKLEDILDEAKATNGRVRKLEIGYAVVKAFGVLFVAVTPFIIFWLNQGG